MHRVTRRSCRWWVAVTTVTGGWLRATLSVMADLFIASIPVDPAYLEDIAGQDQARADFEHFIRQSADDAADRAGARLVTPWAWMWLTEPQLHAWTYVGTGYPSHPLYHDGSRFRCAFALAESH